MESRVICDVLGQLWIIHRYSLAHYLGYAPPWWNDASGSAAELLHNIVADQQQMANRIGKLIIQYGGELPAGKYPTHFTSLHDLSPEFLWQELVSYQERTILTIERLADQLPESSVARALAQECLGVAKAHIDSMQEVAPSLASLNVAGAF